MTDSKAIYSFNGDEAILAEMTKMISEITQLTKSTEKVETMRKYTNLQGLIKRISCTDKTGITLDGLQKYANKEKKKVLITETIFLYKLFDDLTNKVLTGDLHHG